MIKKELEKEFEKFDKQSEKLNESIKEFKDFYKNLKREDKIKTIKTIKTILYKYENSLSDGYQWYNNGPDLADELLEKIAKEILDKIGE